MNKTLGYFALVLATLTGVFLLWQFRSVVMLFVFALALAAAMRRPIDYLSARRLPRGLAVTLTYLIGLGLLGGLLFLLGDALIVEGQAASRGFAAAWEQFRTAWPAGSPLQQFIAQQIPQPDEMYRAVQGALNLQLVQTGLGLTLGVVEAFSRIALVLVLSIYWSIDRDRFERLWLSMLQAERRIRARTRLAGHRRRRGGLPAQHRTPVCGIRYSVGPGLPAAGARCTRNRGPACGSHCADSLARLGPGDRSGSARRTHRRTGRRGCSRRCTPSSCCWSSRRAVAPRLLDHRRYNPMLAVVMMLVLTKPLGIVGLLLAVPLAAVIQIVVSEFLAPAVPVAAGSVYG